MDLNKRVKTTLSLVRLFSVLSDIQEIKKGVKEKIDEIKIHIKLCEFEEAIKKLEEIRNDIDEELFNEVRNHITLIEGLLTIEAL